MSEKNNFQRITEAISYLEKNFKAQPTLEQIAKHLNLSPAHFQRIFTEWAGVSPKQFLQFLTHEHAKTILKTKTPLLQTTYQSGLSSSSRLHDLFIKIQGMTPAEFQNGGQNLQINYDYYDSRFGQILIASTSKGICYLAFENAKSQALKELKELFPKAQLTHQSDQIQKSALTFFQPTPPTSPTLQLHLKGTPFQIQVWSALLKIPSGHLSTYGEIAKQIHNPKACRAVGSAVGDNPVSYLIPCHRVIQSTGLFGQYHWGKDRKTAMIGWEAAQQKL